MSFDWNDYLPLAQQLSTVGSDAARRSAVSRAYYCAFHAASVSLKANNVTTNPQLSRDRHKQVWDVYTRSANRNCRRIGNDGQRLKIERQDADYRADENFTDPRVQHWIARAKNIVADIAVNVPEGFSPNNPDMLTRAIRFVRDLF